MPPFLISLLGRLGAYAALALLAAGFGFYAGYHWCLPQVYAARKALSDQQALDAGVTAEWNAQAAQFQAKIAALSSDVLTARMVERQGAQSAGETQRAALRAQAALPGQDGPVAPVLQAEYANIARLQGAGK
jgi:hypothetical protein